MKMRLGCVLLMGCLITGMAQGQTSPAAQAKSEPALPYIPSLDLASIDKRADPCVNFYQYACGGWKENNPIPADQTSWSVYGKLYQDNLQFLKGILEQASVNGGSRTPVTQQIGDFYAACMDDAAVEKQGIGPVRGYLDAIGNLKSAKEIAPLAAQLQQVYGRSVLFRAGSTQDPDNSEQVIAEIDQGGLGLPDRDYYTKEDAKSKETRERYIQHVQKMFELMGEDPATAKNDAGTVMRLETALAKASLTRVDRRDPYKLKHKMKLGDLNALAPNFDWKAYYSRAQYPQIDILNVATPDFFKEVNTRLADEPLDDWKTYLRFHVVDSASPYLSSPFVDESFEFYRKYLRGAKEQQPRWKRCVSYTDRELGEALGQVYVSKVFPPQLKESTLDMVRRIEDSMAVRIQQLDWMSPETKEQALRKLHGIRNKIGYPDKWRDYSSVKIARDDFAGNVARASEFEHHRDINKIGKPVDRGEWDMSPPTVNAYYNPQMNDINFPAGVLQPPLYDAKNGRGAELRQHRWNDRSRIDARIRRRRQPVRCHRQFEELVDQSGSRKIRRADEVRGRPVCELRRGRRDPHQQQADASAKTSRTWAESFWPTWRGKTPPRDNRCPPRDGLTPEQRFFIGFAQWACSNERPEDLRVRAATDPHSPGEYRING